MIPSDTLMNIQQRHTKTRLALPLAFLTATAALCAAPPDDAQSRRELRRTPVVKAYERARDSVVNISASGRVEVQRWGTNLFGDLFSVPEVREQRSVGSGFILHEDGYIGTNAHVVSAGAQLSVTLANGKTYEARVIGRDTKRDLAVIKVEPDEPLQPIPLGRSDDLMIGEQTIAVGNPVGLHNTVTTGVVSALHRELAVAGSVVYPDVIQTDASINPGNSGGPLLNILGEMIGINTAIRSDAQNIGFAIPVDNLREILPEILDSEKLNRVVVGMRVAGVEPVVVTSVSKDSPADRAGVVPGDEVVSLNGKSLSRAVEFYVTLLDEQAGDNLQLALLRDGRRKSASLKLQAVPKPDGVQLARRIFGLTVADAKDEVARRFELRRRGGVIVLAVDPGSPADQLGLAPGDLLISVGNYWLRDVEQFGLLMSNLSRGDTLDIGFRRVYRGRITEWEGRLYVR